MSNELATVDSHVAVQKGALEDAPEFFNNQTFPVQVFDEDKNMIQVMPDYLRPRSSGIPDNAIFRVKGIHYTQFRVPYGGLVPFRAGAGVAGVAPQFVPQGAVPRTNIHLATPPEQRSYPRQPAATVVPAAETRPDDPDAVVEDALAPDHDLINKLVAATPDATTEERTEVIAVILRRNRGVDASLPPNLERFSPIVQQYAPTVAPADPIPASTATGSDAASMPVKAVPAKPKLKGK